MYTSCVGRSIRTESRSNSRLSAEAGFLWLVICVALTLACYLLSSRPASVGAQDFRGFYAAGEMVVHCPSLLYDIDAQKHWQSLAAAGSQLVTFEHPAYEALLYAPLSFFSYKTAYRIYAECNMLLLGLCFLLFPANSAFAPAYRAALFFLGLPLLLAIFVGQNSILFLLAVCLVYKALAAGNEWLAGLILGLATFKLAIALPLALLLSIRHGRKFVSGFLCTSLAAAALSIGLTGLGGAREFLHLLASATLSHDHSVRAQFEGGIWLHAMPNLSGLLYLLGSGHLSPREFNALNAAAAAGFLAGCTWLQRRASAETTAFSAAVLGAVVVSPHVYIYDLAILPLPFLLLSSPWLKPIAILWLVLPAVLYAVSFPYLMWFAPAVLIALLLLAVCVAEIRRESTRAGGDEGRARGTIMGFGSDPSSGVSRAEEHAR